MKKILAISLALVLVLGLAACGSSGSSSTSSAAPAPAAAASSAAAEKSEAAAPASSGESAAPAAVDGSKPYPKCNEDGSINYDKIAHYDPEYDYTQNEKFKVAYIAESGTALYQQSAEAYEHWAPLFNMEWAGFLSADGDVDMFLTDLQTMIDQGVRGFMLDPDSTTFPAVLSVLEQNKDKGLAWMSQMSPPRDGETGDGVPLGGNMINNYVGFDNVESGRQVTRRLIQWKEETIPDVDWKEVGFLMMEFSVAAALMERHTGSLEVYLEAGGLEENYFLCDCVSTGLTMQGGMDAAGPIVSSHPEIKYWLVNGLIDDFAQGAAAILDQQGLTDTSAICVFGGSALVQQWDSGQQDAFRFAVFTAQSLYGEPIIGAVYAFLNGWVTPDEIWPSWVKGSDHGTDGHTYSQLLLPTESLEYDSYKHYLEWTDMYTHADIYDYPQDGISLDDFTPFVPVPDGYADM